MKYGGVSRRKYSLLKSYNSVLNLSLTRRIYSSHNFSLLSPLPSVLTFINRLFTLIQSRSSLGRFHHLTVPLSLPSPSFPITSLPGCYSFIHSLFFLASAVCLLHLLLLLLPRPHLSTHYSFIIDFPLPRLHRLPLLLHALSLLWSPVSVLTWNSVVNQPRFFFLRNSCSLSRLFPLHTNPS